MDFSSVKAAFDPPYGDLLLMVGGMILGMGATGSLRGSIDMGPRTDV